MRGTLLCGTIGSYLLSLFREAAIIAAAPKIIAAIDS